MKKPEQDSNFFVIEGVLTELHVSPGKENLLEKIDKHYQSKSVITGLGTAVGELYGQVAASAAVAMYEGEFTENFVCLIDNQAVCGTFGGASKLPVGKKVKAIVSKKGNVLVAEGILSDSEGLVWIAHAWGFKAEQLANYKIATGCFLFQLIATFLACLLSGEFGTSFFWFMLKLSVLGGGALCFGVAAWVSTTMNTLADPATAIFRLLGFANPEKINLNSYQYGIIHIEDLVHSNETRANYGNVHCYKKAIADGKIQMISG